MADEIDLVFREGSLVDLQAANYALSSLSSIPEFQDMLAIASSEQRLTIELRGSGFGGTSYIPDTNTIYLDLRQIAGTSYTTTSGGLQQTSLQEVIVHELQHAVQSVEDLSAAIADRGVLSELISSWILEPGAVNLTNQFRTDIWGLSERDGHGAVFNEEQALRILDIAGVDSDGDGQVDSIDVSAIPAEYLDNNLEGFFFRTESFAGIGFGDSFNDLSPELQEELRLRFGYSENSISDGSTGFQIDFCFLGDTSISMWPLDPSTKARADGTYDEELVLSKVWKKPISEIKVGDIVVSYDDKGRIAPSPVTRTMQNNATHILDFWDTGVTPGHAYLCGDGKFKGQHVPLMDILRTDGAIVRDDGTLLRAATNYEVGSLGDRMIHATARVRKSDGTWTEQKRGMVRFGTRIILPDGRHMSFMEMAQSKGWGVSEDGAMTAKEKTENGVEEQKFFFPYTYGEELPKPEDYILSRSEVSLQEIYAAGEWEQIGTRMPAPDGMVGLNTNHTSTLLQPSKPEPNMPPAFANRLDAPRRALNRKQRKAMEAKQSKAAKIRKRVLVS